MTTHKPFAGLVAAALLMATTPSLAIGPGDWQARVGIIHSSPDVDSNDLPGTEAGGAELSVGTATGLGFNFTRMLSSHWGAEIFVGLPMKHKIKADGALSSAGTLVETDQLPVTFFAVYHFTPTSAIRPYIGAGWNYTRFIEETGVGELAFEFISIDATRGPAAQAGIDIDITPDLHFNASVSYTDVETEVNTHTVEFGKTDVSIDPWTLFIGVGWRY